MRPAEIISEEGPTAKTGHYRLDWRAQTGPNEALLPCPLSQ